MTLVDVLKPKAVGQIVRGAALAALLALVAVPNAGAAPLKAGEVAGASAKLTPRLQQLGTPSLRHVSASARAQRLDLSAAGPGSLIMVGEDVVVSARVSSTDAFHVGKR